MASHLPPYYAYSFTPTTHTSVPPSLSPSNTALPHPFVVVVTGAGKGLGYQIALSYARAGASGIAISSRTMADLEGLEREIMDVVKEEGMGRGIEVLKTVCDVRSEESVKDLEREVREKWGRADVVIANAGVISQYIARDNAGDSNLPIGIMEDDDWARVLDTNIMGVWRISTTSDQTSMSGSLTFSSKSIHTPPPLHALRPTNTHRMHQSRSALSNLRRDAHRIQCQQDSV
jgi:NAD(P)-dependent dehydrogenase (short-subunit alcohol dehydrogenase family)